MTVFLDIRNCFAAMKEKRKAEWQSFYHRLGHEEHKKSYTQGVFRTLLNIYDKDFRSKSFSLSGEGEKLQKFFNIY